MKSRLLLLLLIAGFVCAAIERKADLVRAADAILGHPTKTQTEQFGAADARSAPVAAQASTSADEAGPSAETAQAEDDAATPGEEDAAANEGLSLAADSLHSTHAILVRLDDGRVLMDKNIEDRVYPASLTKIMTAILAIERIPDLKKTVKLEPDMFETLRKQNASMAGFLPGERVSAIDLLYGAMLPSGADASVGLATRVAGSESKFAKLMNGKAKAIGMTDTHFVNATGLHDPDHYTTVKDLSVLLAYALKNETFRQVFTASRHSTAPTDLHPDGITLRSSMFKELGESGLAGEEIVGGKTGYTEKAGLCLASLGRLHGKEYILVTTGAQGDRKTTEAYDIADAVNVYSELGNAL
ncbi:D-alanyl-D-alanine carboxypeptidase (penicillin-binding protein 5/6) [Cohnella sp. OV330]|uniref:D-alanyl-D-alanine carboxypeptidase family protein n=1 Tax=Cohnella sp. OV330 TaxID=1855288 RepID=UPI0008EBAB7E|nr:serine hydrolase [Cohnella sp. OV330]SFB41453.1 D-alanyl-D-alanine carboxypeptidase (penicillin-binding protein 5/6) [Cohnella sp. OV330]